MYDPSVADYVKEVHRPNYKLHVIHSSEAWANMSVHPMDGGKNPRKLFDSSGNGVICGAYNLLGEMGGIFPSARLNYRATKKGKTAGGVGGDTGINNSKKKINHLVVRLYHGFVVAGFPVGIFPP